MYVQERKDWNGRTAERSAFQPEETEPVVCIDCSLLPPHQHPAPTTPGPPHRTTIHSVLQTSRLFLDLENVLTILPVPVGSMLPILSIVDPVFLPGNLTLPLTEPSRHKLLASVLSLPLLCPLLLLHPILFRSSKVILAVFHCPLVRTETSVGGWKVWAKGVWYRIEGYDEGGEIEGDAGWTGVGFPNQEGLVGVIRLSTSARGGFHGAFEARGESRVYLVVPSPSDTPSCLATTVHDFPGDLEGGTSFPAALLKFHDAEFTGGPILDFHRTIVVNCWVTSDDTDNGAGHLLPGI